MASLFPEQNTDNAPEQETAELQAITKMNTALELLPAQFPDWLRRSNIAKAALSTITEITTKEQDASAEDIMVKSRATYEAISAERLAITNPVKEAITIAMQPEKAISTDAKEKDSAYNKVRALRNAFAVSELKKADDAKKEAAAKLKKDTEIIRLKSEYEKVYNAVVSQSLLKMENSVAQHIETITLETYEEKIKRFNITPKLLEANYYAIFAIPYDKTALTNEEIDALITEVQAILTYDGVNKEYVELANAKIKEQVDKLPALKAKLEEIEETRKTNADAAAALEQKKKDDAAAAQKEREDKAAEDLQASNSKVDAAANRANLGATFTAQVSSQSVVAQTGQLRKTYKAVIVGERATRIETLADMLLAIYTHPDFKGEQKVDSKTGEMIVDAEGYLEYQPFVAEILKAYEKIANPEKPVTGIELKEVISTVARGKKA